MTQIEIAERNRHIIHLAKDGKTADEITQIVGMKRYRVLQILRAYNVKPVRTSHVLKSKKAQEIIKDLVADGVVLLGAVLKLPLCLSCRVALRIGERSCVGEYYLRCRAIARCHRSGPA